MLVWLFETYSMSLLHYTLTCTLVQQIWASGGLGPKKNIGRRQHHTPDLRALWDCTVKVTSWL
jgi:hypothetical protein